MNTRLHYFNAHALFRLILEEPNRDLRVCFERFSHDDSKPKSRDNLERASKTHTQIFVRFYKIFVWEANTCWEFGLSGRIAL